MTDSDRPAAPPLRYRPPPGPPLSRRQDAFCRHYVACGVGAEAARLAGYKTRHAANTAYRLLARADVRERIDGIRYWIAERECAGRDTIAAKLETIYLHALRSGRIAAAVRAVMAQARISATVEIDRRLPLMVPVPAAHPPLRETLKSKRGTPEDDYLTGRDGDPLFLGGGDGEGD